MRARIRLFVAFAFCGAVAAYALAAWAIAPGFFDGLTPPAPYRWIHPPASLRPDNQQPLSGSGTVTLGRNGSALPGSAFTEDGQATVSWTGGAWQVPGKRQVTLHLAPERSYPATGTLRLATNVYCITSSAPIASDHQVQLTLAYSDAIADAPRQIYEAPWGGSWQALGSGPAPIPYTISVTTGTLGCFVAGSGSPPVPWYAQRLPLLVAGLLVLVIAGGGATYLFRRRRRGAPA
ncbi:MAG: hypothetical protein ACREQM_10865 [Candidatus Dormibacteraceae bacterium]